MSDYLPTTTYCLARLWYWKYSTNKCWLKCTNRAIVV